MREGTQQLLQAADTSCNSINIGGGAMSDNLSIGVRERVTGFLDDYEGTKPDVSDPKTSRLDLNCVVNQESFIEYPQMDDLMRALAEGIILGPISVNKRSTICRNSQTQFPALITIEERKSRGIIDPIVNMEGSHVEYSYKRIELDDSLMKGAELFSGGIKAVITGVSVNDIELVFADYYFWLFDKTESEVAGDVIQPIHLLIGSPFQINIPEECLPPEALQGSPAQPDPDVLGPF